MIISLLNALSILFFVVGLGLSYWIWIRPTLRERPRYADFYARTESFWRAIWLKLVTIKTRLAAKSLMIASMLVAAHDFFAPLVLGIDWTPITGGVPAWAWPLVSFALGGLFLWLRNLASKAHEVELIAVSEGASLAQAAVIAGKDA